MMDSGAAKSAAPQKPDVIPVVYHSTPSAAPPMSAAKPPVATTASGAAATATRNGGMPSVTGLLIIFQDSPESHQRQWAVQMLSRLDWTNHGEVIPALLAAARGDVDRTVRVQCIRCLTARNNNRPPVIGLLRDLQKDNDPRVQQEATDALVRLNAMPTTTATKTAFPFASER
jgi:hypothetical protein